MTESQSVHDRLSDLPLSIIYTILSSLSTKDAVRTSILSTQWRYTWTRLPKLEFIRNADRNNSASEQCLKELISYALSVHKGSLHMFKLYGVLKEPFPNLDEWLIRLSTKDIRELVLAPGFHSLLSSIYSCNKLTRLDLCCFDVVPPPSTFKGFSFLRNLTLCMFRISSATFESLVSSSPLLESLEFWQLTRAEKDSMIHVHAPNLKFLKFEGTWTEISLNAPLLSELWVELQGGPLSRYTNFLGGCTNLTKLIGLGWFTKALSIWMESWNSLAFHRLTTVELRVDFGDVKQQRVLARLLVGAPNLQDLSIMGIFSSETRDAHFSGFRLESNLRMEKLRVVKMDRVRGFLPEIKLIELLLERSPLLEAMIVRHTPRLGTEEIKDLTDKFLGCTRASQTAKISVSASRFW